MTFLSPSRIRTTVFLLLATILPSAYGQSGSDLLPGERPILMKWGRYEYIPWGTVPDMRMVPVPDENAPKAPDVEPMKVPVPIGAPPVPGERDALGYSTQEDRKVVKIKFHSVSTYGLTDEECWDGINAAFKSYEAACNIDLVRVDRREDYNFRTKELYLGGGIHARGLSDAQREWFYVHNGYVSKGHSRKRPNEAFWWKAISSSRAYQTIWMHELGHQFDYFGLSHTSDTNCLMNINASREFCPREQNVLVSRHGRAPVNGPPVVNPDTSTVREGQSVVIRPLVNDSDPEGGVLTIQSATPRDSSLGSVTDIASDQLTYTPDLGSFGTHVIDYTAKDLDGSTASSTITVTVTERPTFPWTNPKDRFDVIPDGLTGRDVLVVINAVGRGVKYDPYIKPKYFYDVNGDKRISNVDSLQVINELNRRNNRAAMTLEEFESANFQEAILEQ